MNRFPSNWTISTLGSICSKPQYGWTCRASKNGILRILRTTDISKPQIDWKSVPFCEIAPDDIDKYKINENDILVSRAGSVGVSCRVDKIPHDTVFASYLIRFKPKPEIIPKYIQHYLKSDDYWKSISEFSAGIAVPNVNASKLSELKIPIAPYAEQHRIVAKLEKLLAKVDKCKERLEKIPAILKHFRQSILVAACSGELTKDWRKGHPEIGTSEDLFIRIQQEKEKNQNKYGIVKKKALEKTSATITRASVPQDEPEIPPSWLYMPSFDLFSFVTSGSRGWAKYYSQEGAKFIRIGNLAHDTIDLNLGSVQHVIPPDGSEGIRTRIQKHDILVSITADTGMIGLIQEDIGEAYINQHVALTRPVKGLDTKYLAWFLASKEGQRQFKALQRGATKVGLGLDDIKSIWVPLPSIAEQKEIVNRIEALFRIADEVETRYFKAVSHVERLTQSILAKAFRGELVPQDPKDEPASELLKRIKAERDVVKNAPKGHRKTRRLG